MKIFFKFCAQYALIVIGIALFAAAMLAITTAWRHFAHVSPIWLLYLVGLAGLAIYSIRHNS